MSDQNNIIAGKRKFGLRDKFGYGSASFGNDLIFMGLVGGYLMVFYTDVFGVSPALIGVLFFIARLWDAFMDIAAGRFADSRPTTSRGKYKPWITRFSVPMYIFAVLMFTKIPGLKGSALVIYAFFAYIIYGTIHSFVAIPFGASSAVISTNSNERASLSACRTAGSNLAQVIVNILIPMFAFINNKPNSTRFFIVAIIMSVLGTICYNVFYDKFTIERLVINKDMKEKPNLLVSFKALVKNRAFLSLVGSLFIVITSLTVVNSFNAYLYKDYFHSAKSMTLNGVLTILNILVVIPLVGPTSKRFGKKESASGALLLSSVMYFLLFLFPIKNVYLYMVLAWFANSGEVFFAAMSWAFVNDAGDYHELITGKREDGTVLSISQYFRKFGQSTANLIVGFSLTAAGYVKVAKGHQTLQVSANIRNYATLIPTILYFIAFLCITFWYPMNRKKLEQLQVDLQEKRAKDGK